MISPRSCEICGSNDKRTLFTQTFAGELEGALLSSYTVVACTQCGFAFADHLPPQVEFDTYYERMSKYEYEHAEGVQADFDDGRFPDAAKFIAHCTGGTEASIVDIGCSNGGLLNALKKIGFTNLLGIDPSPACAVTAKKLYGIDVLTGNLFSAHPEIPSKDVVSLGAVLEHVRDIRGALTTVRSLLKPGGLLYVEVPDVTHFSCTTDAPFQEFSVEHINYFSIQSLNNVMARMGFKTLEARTISMIQGDSTLVHVINAMFRMGDLPSDNFAPLKDETSESALRGYIDASSKVENGIHRALAPWIESGRAIMVWGVGTHTQRLLATSGLAKANISAYVDSNPRYHGKDLYGVPVISPKNLAERPEPVLISSRFFQNDIIRQIREELQLSNQLITLYEA